MCLNSRETKYNIEQWTDMRYNAGEILFFTFCLKIYLSMTFCFFDIFLILFYNFFKHYQISSYAVESKALIIQL